MDHSRNTSDGWDDGAEDYSSANSFGAMTLWFGERALEQIGVQELLQKAAAPVTLVDIGGGPGILSIHLGKLIKQWKSEDKITAPVTLIASDFAPKFVDITAKRASDAQLDFVVPRVLDGQALALDSESVDYAFSTFGLFLFPDRAKGFSEAYRVLKPGGALVITSWKMPMGTMLVMGAVMKRLPQPAAPAAGAQPQQQTPSLALGNEEAINEEMSAAGFKNITITSYGRSDFPFTHNEFLSFVRTNPMLNNMRNKVGVDALVEATKTALSEDFPEPCMIPANAFVSVGWKI